MSDILTIIVDTREQDPFFQTPPEDCIVYQAKLDTGDYSVKGFEGDIAIERKELSDFVSSITHDRNRFERELERMKSITHRYLVVESTWGMIESYAKTGRKKTKHGFKTFKFNKGNEMSFNVSSEALLGSLMAFTLKYGVIPLLARDKAEAERFTLHVLTKFYRYKREGVI